jgi:hypothetical protein
MRGFLAAGALLSAAACLWGAAATPVPALVPLVWAGAFWLPGAWLALPGRGGGAPGREALWMPLAFGPVLFGAGVCAGRMAGLSVAASASVVVCLGAAALLLRLARMPSGPGETRSATGTPPRWARFLPLAAGVAVFALGVIPPVTHAPLRFWGDALLHLPVMQRVLDGGFPPENPFLAGMPVGYFWFYHVTLAPVARLSTLPPDWIPVLFSAQALVVLLWALNRAGRELDLSAPARAAALLLIGVGLSPWGWMHLLAVRMGHPEMNWALVKAYGVSGLLPILNPVDPRLAASLTKVAVSNALPMSLALAVLAAAAPRPGAWAGLRRTVLVAGCLGFHLATGLLLAAGLGVRWAAERFLPAPGPDAQPGPALPARGGVPSHLVPLAAALLAALPYLLLVLRARGGSPLAVGWHGGHALMLHLALAGMWLLCVPVLVPWLRDPRRRGWLAVGLPALVLPFTAHLVDGNEYKGIFFLLVLLAPAAGAGLVRAARGKAWLAGLILLAFLPTPLLVARSLESEIPKDHLQPAERRALREIGTALPPDAVIWTPDPGSGYSPWTLPLDRPAYVSDPYALRIMGQWQSDEVRWRRGSLALAGTPETLPRALAAARARVGGRPLAVLIPPALASRYPWLAAALPGLGYRLEARHPLLALYTEAGPDSTESSSGM